MRSVFGAVLVTISTLILTAGLIFVAVVADRFGGQYIEMRQQEIKSEALQECYSASYYEFKDKAGALIKETIKQNYVNCVKDKGYTTVIEGLLAAQATNTDAN